VGLLAGHTTLSAHMFKLGLTQQQDCRMCGDKKEDSVHIVCHAKDRELWVICSWSPRI
jgi:hypothetical protein